MEATLARQADAAVALVTSHLNVTTERVRALSREESWPGGDK